MRGLRRNPQAGFTYLGILLAIAFLGIGLAAVGTVWATTAQREREQQLLFAGNAYRQAIKSYVRAGGAFPQDLQELLEDTRNGVMRRHLRRLYPDPMTGHADWEVIRGPDGGISGVASTSIGVPLKQYGFEPDDASFEEAGCYCDWRFEYVARNRGRPKVDTDIKLPDPSAPSSF